MHHPAPPSSEVGFLPAMYAFSGPTSLPEFDLGPSITSDHTQRAGLSNNSWETRCLRKHRRRVDDEGCLAKRRKLMVDAEVEAPQHSNMCSDWSARNHCPALPAQQARPALPPVSPAPPTVTLLQASSRPQPAAESSCMEIEAAQRKLQEIENRITLEDDDEDEDLDVEPSPRRPVLVLSDSLKEGLQRDINDILPHTVAQSMSHSCMELVLWRPPEDPFCRKLKGSLQRQRKQAESRQPPTPCPSPTPHSPSSQPADTHSPLYSFLVTQSPGEEDMEM